MYVVNRQKAMLCNIALRQFILCLTTVHVKVGATCFGLIIYEMILGSLYIKMFENYENYFLDRPGCLFPS